MLEFIAGIYQHAPNPDQSKYLKQMGSLTFNESQINSSSIIGIAQSSVVSLFQFTAGDPKLDEDINVQSLDPVVATDILTKIAQGQASIDRAYVSEDYVTIILKKENNA